jgi:hypothetical protein
MFWRGGADHEPSKAARNTAQRTTAHAKPGAAAPGAHPGPMAEAAAELNHLGCSPRLRILLPRGTKAGGLSMKRAFYAAMLMAALPTVAAAQDIGGLYNVNGTNFDGSPYGGQARSRSPPTRPARSWKTGSTSSNGFCMRNDDAFAAGYVMGKDIGLIIYKAAPDGILRGVWTIAGKNGAGTEILTPAK